MKNSRRQSRKAAVAGYFTARIVTYLPPERAKQLRALASSRHLSVAAMARILLVAGLR